MENKSKKKLWTVLGWGVGVLAFSYLAQGYSQFHFPNKLIKKDGIVYSVYENEDYTAITTDPVLGYTLIDENKDGKVDIKRSLATPRYIMRPPSALIISGEGKPTLEDQVLFDEILSKK